MFQIVRGKSILERRIVDHERDAEFRLVTGIAYSNMRGALLTWGERLIPLEYANFPRTDATTGREYALFAFQLGSSQKVQEIVGIGPYEFRSPEERDEARTLAIEGILVHLFSPVKGDWDVDGIRVISEGREWKASDFGYHSSEDIADGSN